MNSKTVIITLVTVFVMTLALGSARPAVADEYADLRETIAVCNDCHGPNGASQDGAFPILAGQEFYYLYVQLKDFKSGLRKNEVMAPVVVELEKMTLRRLATFYSEQTWPRIGFKGDPTRVAAGRTAGDAGQCVACHLGSYYGNSRNPRLAGQHPDYLEKTMLDMKSKARNNGAAMSSLMASFSEEDIAAMAEFMGNL